MATPLMIGSMPWDLHNIPVEDDKVCLDMRNWNQG